MDEAQEIASAFGDDRILTPEYLRQATKLLVEASIILETEFKLTRRKNLFVMGRLAKFMWKGDL